MTASPGPEMLRSLRDNRALLLACEAIGWLHMTGKAHADFLRKHGSAGVSYDEKVWHQALDPDWSARIGWLRARFPAQQWPSTLTELLQGYDAGQSSSTLVGLLQAGHAMASGIEKNLPARTSAYLGQDATHMWLATAFGHPVRNLIVDPPDVLTPNGWLRLIDKIGRLLDVLAGLGASPPADAAPWWDWREAAIGGPGWLRQALVSTLAETRLPNNDVTLWDQSYVAAALFKSAVAGAVLTPNANWHALKSQTRWRVLSVGIGTDHYESRAVRIGDWTGARREIDGFFDDVRKLIEVDLALGSLLYRDDQVLAFTFPGLRFDATPTDPKGSLDDTCAEAVRVELEQAIDSLAEQRSFETPPLCRLSTSTRSFISMATEAREAHRVLAVPIHRKWTVLEVGETQGHVCPVCQLRFNGDPQRKRVGMPKQHRCKVCYQRRRGRLDDWLASGEDTIWISEVADENDRVALLTLSFDVASWLEGGRIDSLRAQSIADWRRFNPTLGAHDNPIDRHDPFRGLSNHVANAVGRTMQAVKSDAVLRSLQDGFQYEADWPTFYDKVVCDRSDAPRWDDAGVDDRTRARWLVHQLFRKNASPGRIHRFWRTTEAFFEELLPRFRELASTQPNRWRTRRVVLGTDNAGQQGWEDRETYLGRWRDAPLEFLYRASSNDFLTICNLARAVGECEPETVLQGSSIKVTGDDGTPRSLTPTSVKTAPGLGAYAPVIVLDRSPERFRILVPLRAVNACVDAAVAKWEQELSRVWNRMPLRAGMVAFTRMTPFQAVIEATRNVEDELARDVGETWRVAEARSRDGVTALALLRPDQERELVTIPSGLPDGRLDAFYPYVQVVDPALRHARDYATPSGTVYRHMMDLAPGDSVNVAPAQLAMHYMDSTATRFEPVHVRHLSDWKRVRDTWALILRQAPSITSLRAGWAALVDARDAWMGPATDGEATERAWLDLARAVLINRLGLEGPSLDALVEATASGVLEQSLEWHLRALKQTVEESV